MNDNLQGLFNSSGEVNAYDREDSIKQLIKYAHLVSHEPSNYGMSSAPTFTEQQKDDLIKRALLTQEGKIALGQAMANPIRRNLDYQGVGRKALIVDPLPQGALPVYDKNIVTAVSNDCVQKGLYAGNTC